MNRKKFIILSSGALVAAGTTSYLLSDKSNITRADVEPVSDKKDFIKNDEKEILFLASLAPSGHNTQPWFVKYLEPYHWIIGNDKNKWLPGVDPTQRETMLSIGAFVQNLDYAASYYGYACQFNTIANSNQDENVVEVHLSKTPSLAAYNILNIKERRTVRSVFATDFLKKDDLNYLLKEEADFVSFIPISSYEYQLINEQTVEANQIQSYRDAAQKELANWIRFSSKDALKYEDGLTPEMMDITGIPAWYVRNFYGKADVMKKDFREQSIKKVQSQVNGSAGWLLITSKDDSVTALLEAGKRMERIFLKVRHRGIALHPMSQILEEAATNTTINQSLRISHPIQFILRIGYIKIYPETVSLRRPVEWFIRT